MKAQKAIVVGAGEVGFHIADRLSREGHDVTVIEQSPETLDLDRLNALVLTGSGASPEILQKAGIEDADLFIAVTDHDEVNIMACILANEHGAGKCIARAKSLEYHHADGRFNASKLGIDLIINPHEEVAREISALVAHGSATEVGHFGDGRVVFVGYQIGELSQLSNTTLRDLAEMRSGMYPMVVTALTRGDETLIPRGDDTLVVGDVVYLTCRKEDLPAVRYLFDLKNEEAEAKRIFVLGGGRVGRQVARKLADSSSRLTVVDRNEAHCEAIAEELEHVQVLRTKGTDIETLRNEGLGKADVFVATTQSDEVNILCSLLAKRLGTKRSIALVNQPEYVDLAPSLGVDACISPRLATAAAILKFVRGKKVRNVKVMESGNAEVLELEIPEGSPISGKKLKTLRVPDHSIVAAIIRPEEVLIPDGESILMPGDQVVVFALPDALHDVEQFFQT